MATTENIIVTFEAKTKGIDSATKQVKGLAGAIDNAGDSFGNMMGDEIAKEVTQDLKKLNKEVTT